ncbi:MAG: hypothetical protein RLZZ385_1671 [Pseudomonadota bacterium]
MPTQETTTRNNSRLTRYLLIAVFAFVAAGGVGFYVYSLTCPCEGMPGGILFGERVNEPVTDWAMVNDVEICQLQVAAGLRPHSLNLNCWANEDGELYVGCMGCDDKYWGYQVGPNERGYIRIAGQVYPIILNRIEDPAAMDEIWRSRFVKLRQRSPEPVPETPRAEGWWAFSVVSVSGSQSG